MNENIKRIWRECAFHTRKVENKMNINVITEMTLNRRHAIYFRKLFFHSDLNVVECNFSNEILYGR